MADKMSSAPSPDGLASMGQPAEKSVKPSYSIMLGANVSLSHLHLFFILFYFYGDWILSFRLDPFLRHLPSSQIPFFVAQLIWVANELSTSPSHQTLGPQPLLTALTTLALRIAPSRLDQSSNFLSS